jgi:putative Holliday junction resolvase
VIGLDIGERRIGVAVSDPSGSVATPLAVLDAASVLGDGRELRDMVEEYEAGLVVAGLPRSLDGTEGVQAQRVRAAVSRLAGFLSVPVTFYDERLSSAVARQAMSAGGVRSREQRGSVDMVAASIILQGYLDAERTARETEDRQ